MSAGAAEYHQAAAQIQKCCKPTQSIVSGNQNAWELKAAFVQITFKHFISCSRGPRCWTQQHCIIDFVPFNLLLWQHTLPRGSGPGRTPRTWALTASLPSPTRTLPAYAQFKPSPAFREPVQ